jgi:hypothetical protein
MEFTTIDGQSVSARSEDLLLYEKLKELHGFILAESGQMWNWPATATLTRSTIARLLYLSEIYDLILSTPGSILEFGVHHGASSSILTNLRAIKEPYNYNRKLFVFDTFSGFVGSSKKDGVGGGDGKFNLPATYNETLESLLTIHQKLNPLPDIIKHQIYEGDASQRVHDFLSENVHTVVALTIFDMDIYQPTIDALTAIIPRMTKGSVIVFDQFNCDRYPGETLAVMDFFKFSDLKMYRSALMPHCAWTRIGD